MPTQPVPGGQSFEYESVETTEDGTRVYRDAQGNVVRTGTTGPNGKVTFQAYDTDPETGQTVGYNVQTGAAGVRKAGTGRRNRRQTEKARQAAILDAQQGYYGGLFNESLGGVTGAYEGMEGELPSQTDLLGGQEWADSQLAGAQADEGAIASQRAALAQLEQMAQGGYTAEEAAAMQRMRMETAQQEKSQRDAVMQQAAMRGMSGGGAELAAQLAAQQGGANRANQMQLETQAQAQRRALQALGMQGDLASGIRGQSFGEEQTRRGAADDFTRWNLDRRGGAAQQRYANRFGLAQAQSDASGRSAELAAGRRSEVQEQQNREDDKRTDRTSKILGSIF